MTSAPPGGARQPRLPGVSGPGTAAMLLVGVTMVGLLIVVLATSTGSVDVIGAPPPVTATATANASATPSSPELTQTFPSLLGSDQIQPLDFPSWLTTLLQGVAVVAIGAVAWVLGRMVWQVMPRLRHRVTTQGQFTMLPELPQAAVVETAGHRLELLQEGSPRNAIVAAWHDLEESTAEAGLPRSPAETSTEYTVRVLHTWDVDPHTMAALADLYREARFSNHPMTEQHREQAVALLTEVHTDIELSLALAAAEAERAEAERAAAERAEAASASAGGAGTGMGGPS